MYNEPLAVHIIDEDSVLVELRDKDTHLWRGYACLSGSTFLDCREIVYRLATDNTYGCYAYDNRDHLTPICYLTREGKLIRSRG